MPSISATLMHVRPWITPFKWTPICLLLLPQCLSAQGGSDARVVRYALTIAEERVHPAGKEVSGMTVNGTIPGPTLRFTEGDSAVIQVTNTMEVATSVHWHGILLPNYQDGVPYLTTPPIAPGTTFTYHFPIQQAGTYWYHSHTMLQEQVGVYGSIVIEPRAREMAYDRDLVLVISDWTNEKPKSVLRNLRRGNEWYQVKKGTATPLGMVTRRGALGAQLDFWRQRMEGADIADVAYDAFLFNGVQEDRHPELMPGERVRLRIINASASSQYWLTFGGADPLLIAADGQDVEPVRHNKTFIAIAETYDFLVTIPADAQLEVRATVQDGSGTTSAFLGNGPVRNAPDVPRPDKVAMMQRMAKMDMRMGAPATKLAPGNEDAHRMKAHWGMRMDMPQKPKEGQGASDHAHHSMPPGPMDDMQGEPHMGVFAEFNYDHLKARAVTTLPATNTTRTILLNLTGNMWRYVWSMNGVPLSEADVIEVHRGETIRLTLNNLTMMHHPMHLHGHFFRVLNAAGERSPLKHTVNVPPMQEVTIEFAPDEAGDWFFHCHVLYHMMMGMARVWRTEGPDPRMALYPMKHLLKETNRSIQWGEVDMASHHAGLSLVSTNSRDQWMLGGELGWNERLEAEATYERYLYDYLSVFAGANVENEADEGLPEARLTGIGGIRFFTPYRFDLDVRLDTELRPQIGLGREVMLFRRFIVSGDVEYRLDPGWRGRMTEHGTAGRTVEEEWTWSADGTYMLSRQFSLVASYDNRFGAGAGISARF
ncbi:MAG: multicopper oxidase domain-containing protein [Flavobacteriales bacterium]